MVKIGGDSGRYWRVSRNLLTVVDPATIKVV